MRKAYTQGLKGHIQYKESQRQKQAFKPKPYSLLFSSHLSISLRWPRRRNRRKYTPSLKQSLTLLKLQRFAFPNNFKTSFNPKTKVPYSKTFQYISSFFVSEQSNAIWVLVSLFIYFFTSKSFCEFINIFKMLINKDYVAGFFLEVCKN